MAVYSMTGYASLHANPDAQEGQAGCQIGVEIRSVNSRFLDLSFKLNDDLRASEPALRELLAKAFKRGKIEVRGWVEGKGEQTTRAPQTADLQRLNALQDAIQAWLPDARGLSVAEVLQLAGRNQAPHQDHNPHFQSLVDTAVVAMKEARAREGERLAAMLRTHAKQLLELADKAVPLVPQLVEQQRQRFLTRWNEAMGSAGQSGDLAAANDRALTEATAYAIRIDVAEELTRLRSHLQEIKQLLKTGGELGKRLDFLIQELHREANTLGSKSSSLELTRISVDMKVLIEQMREQVQNIE